MGERFLAEAVFAHPHGHHGGDGVIVIGSTHGHRVDLVPHLGQHVAEVKVLLGVGEAGSRFVQGAVVDIADRDDFALPPGVGGIAGAFPSHANAGELDLLIQRTARLLRSSSAGAPGHPVTGTHRGGGFQETTTILQVGHGGMFSCLALNYGRRLAATPTCGMLAE